MRQCPTLEGEMTPLITHRIGVGVCFQRQSANYHKCHRCVYRGQPADFEVPSHARLTPHLTALGRNGSVELLEAAAKATSPAGRKKGAPGSRRKKKTQPKKARSRKTRGTRAKAAGKTPG